jgi:NAD(P)-dependent dehydrogenase (short-subunit alcohol dehydrogenase family)
MDVDGEVVIVTGAAYGIGQEFARGRRLEKAG